ncbi:MAG: YdcF family protein [Cyanobacteria bacterium P01_D01_bin.73]
MGSRTRTAPRRFRRRFVLMAFVGALIGTRAMDKLFSDGARSSEPDAIFVLGGSISREREAANLAARYPNLPVWVSSGTPEDYVRHHVFRPAKIDDQRLHLDYRAVDTVTNFTTLVDDFDRLKIQSIYLVTSDDHMPRAMAIAQIVFGSRGITVKPVAVPSGRPPEPKEKVWRDQVRSLIWLCTGWTGDNLRKTKT